MLVLLLIFLVKVFCLNLNKKQQVQAGDDGTKAVQIMVPLKYLSNFWRILETPLINWKINLILTCSANCVISNAAVNQARTFAIRIKTRK